MAHLTRTERRRTDERRDCGSRQHRIASHAIASDRDRRREVDPDVFDPGHGFYHSLWYQRPPKNRDMGSERTNHPPPKMSQWPRRRAWGVRGGGCGAAGKTAHERHIIRARTVHGRMFGPWQQPSRGLNGGHGRVGGVALLVPLYQVADGL